MEARIVALDIEGFGSFRKKASFAFPDGDQVVLIDGKWKGASTRSGSGKSTILKAIAFLLDIEDSSQSSLKNWDSKKMRVGGKFLVGNDTVEVVRDPKLQLTINGELYNSLTLGAKEKLTEMLGGNGEIIKSITYRKQRKPGKIIHSTDSKIKEFLTEPLKLAPVELAADQFASQYNKVAMTVELLKRDEAMYVNNLPMNQVTELEATNAQQAVDAAMANYTSAKARYDELLKPQDSTLQADVTRLNAEISKVNEVSNQVGIKTRENASIKATVLQLQAEIATLEKNVCHTCNQEWKKAQEAVAQKNGQIDQYIGQMRVNIEYMENAQPILQSMPTLQAQLQEVQRKIGEASAPIQMAYQTVNSAVAAVNAANSTVNLLNQKRANWTKQNDQLADTRAKIAANEREMIILQTSAQLLGRSGFLGSIFDEILADIEARTNDMLQHFPNAEQFTVQISSSKTLKKGTTKKEISVTISRGGIDVEFEGISGGQQSAIELCTDLAYAEAVRARSGCAPRWTCLDEVMDGLGPAEKEQVVEMIRKRIKGLVLMIEHATEIKASFDQVINIEYDGRESHVTSN